jgi:hypothetical protein
MTLWNELLRRACTHRFAWPRIDADGRHYQICLLCGTAYEYDWALMCRTNRRLALPVPQVNRAGSLPGPQPPSPKQPG